MKDESLENANGVQKRAALLALEDVGLAFYTPSGKRSVLKKVNLVIYSNQTVGIVGREGSGKTCLARILCSQTLAPSARRSGRVRWYGEEKKAHGQKCFATQEKVAIGLISSHLNHPLFPNFCVGTQLCEFIKFHSGLSSRIARKKTLQYLALTGISAPETVYRLKPVELTRFQAFQVNLAMALSRSCLLIVVDEPWRDMEFVEKIRAIKLLKALQSLRKFSLVLLSSDLGILADSVDFIYILNQGEIVEQGPWYTILEQPHHPETRWLLRQALKPQALTPPSGLDAHQSASHQG